MTYVIGDIHGNKEKFEQMLEKLNPKDTDAVFVIGNVLCGESGIGLLQDMMYRANIFPVLGKQEYYAKRLLPLIADCGSIEKAAEAAGDEDKSLLADWVKLKCEKTVSDFLALDEEGREAILDYLSEFAPYEEITEGGKTFVITSSGIRSFREDTPLEDYTEEDFVFAETDYMTPYFSDKYLVTGNKPTAMISREFTGKVYSKKRHLAIDCGALYGGNLAAVCLNPLKVFYC
jgi:serine/threonine protein phosphatase 1